MHCRPVAVHVERTQLDALRPDRGRLRPGDVDDHAEEAPDAKEAATREEGGRRVVTDEVRRFEHHPLTGRPVRAELEGAVFEEPQDRVPDPAAPELRMDVPVADEPPSPPFEQMRDPGEATVELDQPRVALEIEPVPLVAQLVRGPVGDVEDGLVGRA